MCSVSCAPRSPTLGFGICANEPLLRTWRGHSCLQRRHSCRRSYVFLDLRVFARRDDFAPPAPLRLQVGYVGQDGILRPIGNRPSDERARARQRRVANPPQVANLPYIAPESLRSPWHSRPRVDLGERWPLTACGLVALYYYPSYSLRAATILYSPPALRAPSQQSHA